MWNLFVGILREHWENGKLLPHTPYDQLPDWGTSLLEQKLVMVSVC